MLIGLIRGFNEEREKILEAEEHEGKTITREDIGDM